MPSRTPMPEPADPRPSRGTRAIDAACAALAWLHAWLARWLTQAIRWLWIRQNRLSLSLRFCVAAAGLALMAATAAWYLPARFAARAGFSPSHVRLLEVGGEWGHAQHLAHWAWIVAGLSLLAAGTPRVEWPELAGFNFEGGLSLSPEFFALLVGLVVYTSAFVAEIVRSGIQSVHKGQSEAAQALGLTQGQKMRLVILPQAMRVIIPPMTSQYLNLTKNSSLAVVIGYPDLVSISNTSINQTGQAIEVIAIFMAVYLALSLVTSLLMNMYNRAVALKER